MSVNLSARQLGRDRTSPARIAHALQDAGHRPAGLHLEITETVLLDDVDPAVESLQQLKLIGVRLASTTSAPATRRSTYLWRLPVDSVKIDRSFVAGLGVSDRDSSVVAAIIRHGRLLGHDLVAEGVETDQQWLRRDGLGCEMAQGYLVAARAGGRRRRHARRLSLPLPSSTPPVPAAGTIGVRRR